MKLCTEEERRQREERPHTVSLSPHETSRMRKSVDRKAEGDERRVIVE